MNLAVDVIAQTVRINPCTKVGAGELAERCVAALELAGYVILRKNSVRVLCPFRDPSFDIPNTTPCPKCGMLGDINAEYKCIDSAR